jgi:phosphomannomutase
MKPLLLFDVDGTIAESGQIINTELLELFEKLSKNYDLGIVGGGKYEKIIVQLSNTKFFTHIFAECGCVYYKLNSNLSNLSNLSNYQLVYKKNIRVHPVYKQINQLIKLALGFLSQVDYDLTGHFIDLRNGIIYISLIGMVALEEERKYFIDLDKKQNIRKTLIDLLVEKAEELQINNQVKILEGGAVGIGIYPVEYGKAQVLDSLSDYNDICYFGDKYTPDGNDYELISHPKIKGYPVDSIEDTSNILNKLV